MAKDERDEFITWLLKNHALVELRERKMLPSPKSVVRHPDLGILVGADVLAEMMPQFDSESAWSKMMQFETCARVTLRGKEVWQWAWMWRWHDVRLSYRTKLRHNALASKIESLFKRRE